MRFRVPFAVRGMVGFSVTTTPTELTRDVVPGCVHFRASSRLHSARHRCAANRLSSLTSRRWPTTQCGQSLCRCNPVMEKTVKVRHTGGVCVCGARCVGCCALRSIIRPRGTSSLERSLSTERQNNAPPFFLRKPPTSGAAWPSCLSTFSNSFLVTAPVMFTVICTRPSHTPRSVPPLHAPTTETTALKLADDRRNRPRLHHGA